MKAAYIKRNYGILKAAKHRQHIKGKGDCCRIVYPGLESDSGEWLTISIYW